MNIKTQPLWPLVVITGPTATGKSEVGVRLAEHLDGEVISADSMLIYRGMDIGTAKPTPPEMRGIPHHMIDLVEPDEDYSVALFQKQARSVVEEVLERKKLPLLVGGTGLYIGAVIDPYDFSGARGDPSIRESLQKEALEKGPDSLHRRLLKVDPGAASKLHPKDTRRVVRALEVFYLTGKPISTYQTMDRVGQPIYDLFMFGLTMDRARLYRRIEQRVDHMVQAGLVDEVKALLQRGSRMELNSMRGLGYKEIAEYLTGACSLGQAVELLKRNTRRFAKRQLTWFRRDTRIQWYNVDEAGGPKAVAEEINQRLEGVL